MSYSADGWFLIEYGTDDDGEAELGVGGMAHLRRLIADLDRDSPLRVSIDEYGPRRMLLVHGQANHSFDHPESLDVVLAELGARFPGSYGLMHEYIGDRDEPLWDVFRVRVMRRGKVEIVADPFFSPKNPVIED